MADIRKDIYGMDKKAILGMGSLAPSIGNLVSAIGDLGAIGMAYLATASMLTGAGAGWLAAKATAKGKQDYDTAQKGYENEALASDIGYFSSKIKQERDARKTEQTPKAMRAF